MASPWTTPDLQLTTLFVLNSTGRILSTREPGMNRAPLFSLVRNAVSHVWAIREDVPKDIASEIDWLARDEPSISNFQEEPVHARRYVSILSRVAGDGSEDTLQCSAGPAFEFPDEVAEPGDVVVVEDEGLLHRNFRGWMSGEIAAGRAPLMAVFRDDHPVSICFCARSSNIAAEAGVETAEEFRGRGYARRVTAAWALAIRKQGRTPLYSTTWTNIASLAVAQSLRLRAYASDWSLSDDVR